MPKRLVFCADGTWDDPSADSNVSQFYQALDNIPTVQIPIYDSGVGTSGVAFEKLLDGAVGADLFQKIKNGYAAVASQFQPDDEIFLFGFSRGAYTVRSLAGMIAICGLPTLFQIDSRCVDIAFEAYRNAAQREQLLQDLMQQYAMNNAKIRLLGVWDTVGSLGIPAIFGGVDPIQYGFLSTDLHPDILNAVQTIAIDEQRMQFQPTLWTTSSSPDQTVIQVWFTGVHCDVGGGYPPDENGARLANITLRWMVQYAERIGLTFKVPAGGGQLATDAVATMHQSRTGLYKLFPAHARNIAPDSSLSSTVNLRLQSSSEYRPTNLHIVECKLATTYDVIPVN